MPVSKHPTQVYIERLEKAIEVKPSLANVLGRHLMELKESWKEDKLASRVDIESSWETQIIERPVYIHRKKEDFRNAKVSDNLDQVAKEIRGVYVS